MQADGTKWQQVNEPATPVETDGQRIAREWFMGPHPNLADLARRIDEDRRALDFTSRVLHDTLDAVKEALGYAGPAVGVALVAHAAELRQKRDALAEEVAGPRVDRPPIVCLCGSTRFWETFRDEGLRLTLEGYIVLSIGVCAPDSMVLAHPETPEGQEQKRRLDELHKRKIDLADEVLVLDLNGYIGESTRSEIEYAVAHGKPVRYLSRSLPPSIRGLDPDFTTEPAP